jgi:hypothetical protein
MRGASGFNTLGIASLRNTILPDGRVNGLNLAGGETLVAYPGVAIPVRVLGNLSIDTTAKFDITDNAAIVDYSGTSPAQTVRAKILSGRGGTGFGSAWNSMGISSSAAAAANVIAPDSRSIGFAENSTMPLGSYTNFRGQPVDKTSILMAYTRTADANLDGVVNEKDVTIVGATYAPGVPNPNWAFGDFDYNGFVDDDDVTLLGVFYNPSASPIPAPAAIAAGGVAAVPEPASFTLWALAGCAMVLVARQAVTQRARLGCKGRRKQRIPY